MNFLFRVKLDATEHQVRRLHDLQIGFAQLCNALMPVVQSTNVWNRVALHHLAYKKLRSQYPAMGAQMVCNAIYSVSRTCRMIFQNPASPFYVKKLGERALPRLRFSDSSPVYFDRHTLSIKHGQLSMFTLEGRVRFQIALSKQHEELFHTQKLLEIVLVRQPASGYELVFLLEGKDEQRIEEEQLEAYESDAVALGSNNLLPEYVQIEESM